MEDFWHRLDILMFCQNTFTPTYLNKSQKMRGWTLGGQKSHANQRKIFYDVFAPKFASFLCPQNGSALFVGHANTFIIW